MRAGTLLTTWFTRTGHGHDLGVLAVVNMEWLVRSEVWAPYYGVWGEFTLVRAILPSHIGPFYSCGVSQRPDASS